MARVVISIGAVRIEYEGEPDFLPEGLMKLAGQVADLVDRLPESAISKSGQQGAIGALKPTTVGRLSTNTIAQALDVKTGSDLAFAAVAKIILVDNKNPANRADILDEMKAAVSYYKDTYSGNLSASLKSLMKGKRLNLVSENNYSIPASEMKTLEASLADAG